MTAGFKTNQKGGRKVDEVQRAIIRAAVERCGGYGKAAKELGLHKSTVRSSIRRAAGYKLVRRKAVSAPIAPRVNMARHLVGDHRKGDTIQRRRWDCKHLSACELAWIDEHGPAQGRCAGGCKGYQKEARR